MSVRTYQVAVLAGDGVGPEVVAEGLKVVRAALAHAGPPDSVRFVEAPIGWAAIDQAGVALPDATRRLCAESDAIFFGAVGDPARDASLPPHQRPEVASILQLRRGLWANLRPARLYPALAHSSPLKPALVAEGIDLLILRELNGGIYYGPRGRKQENGHERAWDTMEYTTPEIERVVRKGFELARGRRRQLCSVDKANVLASSQLWRETVLRIAPEYPDVELTHMYVDNAAMQLVRRPSSFDVIVTENSFGDILSDEASVLVGSIGLLPSASLGDAGATPLFEPIHGSAPDIAGQGIANPVAAILSGAMMLRYALGRPGAADAIERAVEAVIAEGLRTPDIAAGEAGERRVTTSEFGDAVAARVTEALRAAAVPAD